MPGLNYVLARPAYTTAPCTLLVGHLHVTYICNMLMPGYSLYAVKQAASLRKMHKYQDETVVT